MAGTPPLAVEVSDDGEPRRWLIVEKWRSDSTNEEDRSTSVCQLLDNHRNWAEHRARELARNFNLPEQYADMLCAAAFLHDEGKRSDRWQRAFNTPDAAKHWAKTEGPINFPLLDGYRHEFGSIVAVENHERLRCLPEDLRDLALHLIAAHHGFARPFIDTRGCDVAPPSILEPYAKAIALRFGRLQQQWGPWGLAWWESLLRASDQRASRDNDPWAIPIVVAARSGGE
jgi:CRISPR-associated endonuclease/helicase Cas3